MIFSIPRVPTVEVYFFVRYYKKKLGYGWALWPEGVTPHPKGQQPEVGRTWCFCEQFWMCLLSICNALKLEKGIHLARWSVLFLGLAVSNPFFSLNEALIHMLITQEHHFTSVTSEYSQQCDFTSRLWVCCFKPYCSLADTLDKVRPRRMKVSVNITQLVLRNIQAWPPHQGSSQVNWIAIKYSVKLMTFTSHLAKLSLFQSLENST